MGGGGTQGSIIDTEKAYERPNVRKFFERSSSQNMKALRSLRGFISNIFEIVCSS